MGIEWKEDSPAQRAQIQTLYESLKGLRSFSERSTKAAAKYSEARGLDRCYLPALANRALCHLKLADFGKCVADCSFVIATADKGSALVLYARFGTKPFNPSHKNATDIDPTPGGVSAASVEETGLDAIVLRPGDGAWARQSSSGRLAGQFGSRTALGRSAKPPQRSRLLFRPVARLDEKS